MHLNRQRRYFVGWVHRNGLKNTYAYLIVLYTIPTYWEPNRNHYNSSYKESQPPILYFFRSKPYLLMKSREKVQKCTFAFPWHINLKSDHESEVGTDWMRALSVFKVQYKLIFFYLRSFGLCVFPVLNVYILMYYHRNMIFILIKFYLYNL